MCGLTIRSPVSLSHCHRPYHSLILSSAVASSQLTPGGVVFRRRYVHSSVLSLYPAATVFVFAGYSNVGYLSDVWAYTVGTSE